MYLFGGHRRIPLDLSLDITGTETLQLNDYVKKFKDRMKDAFRMAKDASDRARRKKKVSYDLKVRGAKIEVGDNVLVKILAFYGKHKITDRWEEHP